MSIEFLINFTPQETRVAIVEQGVVQELHVERTASRGIVGNIYLGKVVRVLPGMQSAFIDIGLERTAFLHVADIWSDRQNGEAARPIEKILTEGQSLMVQVLKDPIGTKGARLSTQISLAGRLLVYLPQEKHIGISQRIEDEAEREALRGRLTALVPDDEPGGFIVRTMAESASDTELAADIGYLRKLWGEISRSTVGLFPPKLLHEDLGLGQRTLRDLVNDETSRIRVNSRENFQKLTAFAAEYTPKVLPLLEHYSGERPLFDLYSVEEEIQKALARRVDLKSGGYLIIDQTEAMTTIDINTGAFVGHRNLDDTIFNTNIEATQAIARQLRLRNLGGIIIIDFIDMNNEDHRRRVLHSLEQALSKDRVKTSINGFSQLGLVEMTRKRTRESVEHVLCNECPTCHGRGTVKSVETVCYEIMREIVRVHHAYDSDRFLVYASPAVAETLKGEESHALAEVEIFVGKQVKVQIEPLYNQEQFDVVMM